MTSKQMIKNTGAILVIMLLIGTIYCGGKSEVRKYKEEGTQPKATGTEPVPGMTGMSPHGSQVPMEPHAEMHFKWDTPAGWTEDLTPSSMRMASFYIKSKANGKESLCTMIPLQGDAGGLDANVERWLSQVKAEGTAIPPDITADKVVQKREKFLTKGQFPAALVDFTPFTPKPTDNTFIVCVISLQDSSVFVKLMGEKSNLIENKEKFKTLCQSFTFTKPSTTSTATSTPGK